MSVSTSAVNPSIMQIITKAAVGLTDAENEIIKATDSINALAKKLNGAVKPLTLYGKYTAAMQTVMVLFLIAIFILVLVFGERFLRQNASRNAR